MSMLILLFTLNVVGGSLMNLTITVAALRPPKEPERVHQLAATYQTKALRTVLEMKTAMPLVQ
jgi:hypothetical protein